MNTIVMNKPTRRSTEPKLHNGTWNKVAVSKENMWMAPQSEKEKEMKILT